MRSLINFFSLLVLLFGIGLFAVYSGCKDFRFLQRVKNTPTSKVSSTAIGFVELTGHAERREPVLSPVSQVPCIYWRLAAEYCENDMSGNWRTILKTESRDMFYLDDSTGRMLVDPQSAEIDISPAATFEGYLKEFVFLDRDQGSMDYRVIRYIRDLDAPARSLFESHESEKIRFTEFFIREGDPLYILGTAEPREGMSGSINHETLIIRKGTRGDILYITDTTEKEVVDRVFSRTSPKIIVGLIISTLCLFGIMMMLKTDWEKVFFLGFTAGFVIIIFLLNKNGS